MVSSVGVNPVVVNKPENKKSNVGKFAGAWTGLLIGASCFVEADSGIITPYRSLYQKAAESLDRFVRNHSEVKDLLSSSAAKKDFMKNELNALKKVKKAKIAVGLAIATTLGLAIGAIVDKVRDNIKAKKAQKVEQ